MWLLLAFASAFFLGLYDTSKKLSVRENAVIPVLFLSTFFSCIITSSILFLPCILPEYVVGSAFEVHQESFYTHGLIFIKSIIVSSSWILNYIAMKHLPITITSPISATRPMITLVGAFCIFGERLNLYQWIGVLCSVFSLYLLSIAGRKEGIEFRHSKWVVYMVLATIIGAISALYDKFLLSKLSSISVQVYNNIYQVLIMGGILFFLWYPHRRESTSFSWRWSILFISVFITIADALYYYALTFEGSMISIVSVIRRGSVLVSFLFGVFLFRERNLKMKILDLLFLVIGMIFLYLGSK
ncbi:MAG TPA: EamA family transporter [Porphyromonadaceae bacterium]|nr:EamA family transporter [Porphyromonadaceae bacterium]